jgi:hypothetical protein
MCPIVLTMPHLDETPDFLPFMSQTSAISRHSYCSFWSAAKGARGDSTAKYGVQKESPKSIKMLTMRCENLFISLSNSATKNRPEREYINRGSNSVS